MSFAAVIRSAPKVAALAALVALACPVGVGAQLISPGKLSSAHANLSGIRNCTQCHELRKPGISQALCLGCHKLLAERLQAEKGFHASLPDQACATCHKEHFGAAFDLIRLDTLTFDHQRTGYGLEASHVDVSCRSCHTPDHLVDERVRAFKEEGGALQRTFMGLAPTCASCHEEDAPHKHQFASQACSACHDTGAWDEPSAFDHDKADFRLTGEHLTVTCDKCHKAWPQPAGRPDFVQYDGVLYARCNDCHEDEHRGAMPGACAGCHTTGSWAELDRKHLETSFNHRATGFPLDGRHARAPCASCHTAAAAAKLAGIHVAFTAGTEGVAFPHPEDTRCVSCHDDEHKGAMSSSCEACHTAARWQGVDPSRLSASFDHASTGFTLEGSHATATCAGCHDDAVAEGLQGIRLAFEPGTEAQAFPRPGHATCMACHEDRHEGTFQDAPSGPDCRGCHGQKAWNPADFDGARHDRETEFRLDGAHTVVACVDCHIPTEEAALLQVAGTECADCHQEADPHGDQFSGRSCDACHTTELFTMTDFDHARTRFPLDGEHEGATCQSCHETETNPSGDSLIRYRPVGIECRECHGGRS